MLINVIVLVLFFAVVFDELAVKGMTRKYLKKLTWRPNDGRLDLFLSWWSLIYILIGLPSEDSERSEPSEYIKKHLIKRHPTAPASSPPLVPKKIPDLEIAL